MFRFLFLIYLFYKTFLCVCGDENIDSFKSGYCQIKCLDFEVEFQESEPAACIEHCMEKNFSLNYNEVSSYETPGLQTFSPRLHCRSEDALTFWWEPFEEAAEYLLELEDTNSSWKPIAIINETIYTFINLTSHSEYRIRLWSIMDERIVGPILSNWSATLDKEHTPLTVPNVWVSEIGVVDEDYKATIHWTPNEDDRVCFYDLIWYGDDGIEFGIEEVREPKEMFEAQIKSLKFEMNYSIGVMAKNSALDHESNTTWIHFETLSCLEIYADLEKCAPLPPHNLTSYEEVVEENDSEVLYDVTVSWAQPELEPDNYVVSLKSLTPSKFSNQSDMTLSVPGSQTQVTFTNVYVGVHYLITVFANSTGGRSPAAILYRQTSQVLPVEIASISNAWIIGASLFIVCVMFIALFAGFFAYQKRVKCRRYQQRCKYFETFISQELEEKSPKTVECIKTDIEAMVINTKFEKDSWEIAPDQIILGSTLGEGAFGLVRKGWIKETKGTGCTPVAVKMLKETPSIEATKQFLHEIEIMKSVGTHPNLVSIIGCCTNSEPNCSVMLVVEYCSLGDLQNYLRNAWDRMISSQPAKYINLPQNVTCNLVVNKLYEIEGGGKNEADLQPCDLLSFARQIAKGMEFLSNLKVLHRDLAARNVLVCADKSVKVADFGLSRDVYRDNVYHKTGNSKLPIRWMAIESLTHQMYTSHSDVWSFGILLWEIVTLGGNPYPSVPTNELLNLLCMGYRMERPPNCGLELYSLMRSCWKTRPKDRPSFVDLRKSLDKLLESMTTAKYLDLEVLTSPEGAAFRVPANDTFSVPLS